MLYNDDAFYQRAQNAAQEYVASHPGVALSEEPPFTQGYSHRVVKLTVEGQPAVFKLYVNASCWAAERKALQRLAGFAPVPQIWGEVPDRALLLSRLPGEPLSLRTETAEEGTLTRIFHDLGRVLAGLSLVPGDRSEYAARLERDLAGVDRVLAAEPTYQSDFWSWSHALQARHLSHTKRDAPLLPCNGDINPANIITREDRLSGIVDWEACRTGDHADQLGVALFTCVAYSFAHAKPGSLWQAFCSGYRELVPEFPDTERILARAHIKAWGFIHRDGQYGLWSETPDWYRLPDASHVEQQLRACEEILKQWT